MQIEELKEHVDQRLDKLESKMDDVVKATIKHTDQIEHLQGFSKLVITILLAVCGFFALAYFN